MTAIPLVNLPSRYNDALPLPTSTSNAAHSNSITFDSIEELKLHAFGKISAAQRSLHNPDMPSTSTSVRSTTSTSWESVKQPMLERLNQGNTSQQSAYPASKFTGDAIFSKWNNDSLTMNGESNRQKTDSTDVLDSKSRSPKQRVTFEDDKLSISDRPSSPSGFNRSRLVSECKPADYHAANQSLSPSYDSRQFSDIVFGNSMGSNERYYGTIPYPPMSTDTGNGLSVPNTNVDVTPSNGFEKERQLDKISSMKPDRYTMSNSTSRYASNGVSAYQGFAGKPKELEYQSTYMKSKFDPSDLQNQTCQLNCDNGFQTDNFRSPHARNEKSHFADDSTNFNKFDQFVSIYDQRPNMDNQRYSPLKSYNGNREETTHSISDYWNKKKQSPEVGQQTYEGRELAMRDQDVTDDWKVASTTPNKSNNLMLLRNYLDQAELSYTTPVSLSLENEYMKLPDVKMMPRLTDSTTTVDKKLFHTDDLQQYNGGTSIVSSRIQNTNYENLKYNPLFNGSPPSANNYRASSFSLPTNDTYMESFKRSPNNSSTIPPKQDYTNVYVHPSSRISGANDNKRVFEGKDSTSPQNNSPEVVSSSFPDWKTLNFHKSVIHVSNNSSLSNGKSKSDVTDNKYSSNDDSKRFSTEIKEKKIVRFNSLEQSYSHEMARSASSSHIDLDNYQQKGRNIKCDIPGCYLCTPYDSADYKPRNEKYEHSQNDYNPAGKSRPCSAFTESPGYDVKLSCLTAKELEYKRLIDSEWNVRKPIEFSRYDVFMKNDLRSPGVTPVNHGKEDAMTKTSDTLKAFSAHPYSLYAEVHKNDNKHANAGPLRESKSDMMDKTDYSRNKYAYDSPNLDEPHGYSMERFINEKLPTNVYEPVLKEELNRMSATCDEPSKAQHQSSSNSSIKWNSGKETTGIQKPYNQFVDSNNFRNDPSLAPFSNWINKLDADSERILPFGKSLSENRTEFSSSPSYHHSSSQIVSSTRGTQPVESDQRSQNATVGRYSLTQTNTTNVSSSANLLPLSSLLSTTSWKYDSSPLSLRNTEVNKKPVIDKFSENPKPSQSILNQSGIDRPSATVTSSTSSVRPMSPALERFSTKSRQMSPALSRSSTTLRHQISPTLSRSSIDLRYLTPSIPNTAFSRSSTESLTSACSFDDLLHPSTNYRSFPVFNEHQVGIDTGKGYNKIVGRKKSEDETCSNFSDAEFVVMRSGEIVKRRMAKLQ